MSFIDQIKKGWNAFTGKDFAFRDNSIGYSSSYRPDRTRFTRGNERTIVTSIYNRIAVDVSEINFEHVRVDENRRYRDRINSGLQNCLTIEANADQTARALFIDIVSSLFDEGVVCLVPTDASINPNFHNGFDVLTLRTGKILEWYPMHVKVSLYNERTGRKEEIILDKSACGIIENPFYAVMNESNGTLQRLIRTLNKIEYLNGRTVSGRLDLLIQLPYAVKNEIKMKQAEDRRASIEKQLVDSKYGIAYIDSTEHVTQLNKTIENNLWQQAQDLKEELYNQLGLTKAIFDGTANEAEMNNYYARTIDPICNAIADEMIRKFLTKTARTQGQTIRFYRDPFKLVPVSSLADIADKFTRNEILTSNELRGEIGFKPVDDPKADTLRNSNLNASDAELEQMYGPSENRYEEEPYEDYGEEGGYEDG